MACKFRPLQPSALDVVLSSLREAQSRLEQDCNQLLCHLPKLVEGTDEVAGAYIERKYRNTKSIPGSIFSWRSSKLLVDSVIPEDGSCSSVVSITEKTGDGQEDSKVQRKRRERVAAHQQLATKIRQNAVTEKKLLNESLWLLSNAFAADSVRAMPSNS